MTHTHTPPTLGSVSKRRYQIDSAGPKRSEDPGVHARKCRRCAGFTLVELIIVSSLIGMVAAASGTIMWQVSGARQRIDRRAETHAQADAAVRAITNAIANAYRPGENESTIFEGLDETSNGLPADRLRLLTVSRRVIRPGEPESDVHEVEFALASMPDEPIPVLTKRTDPTRNAPEDGGGVVDRIAPGVISLDFEYFDGLSWQTQWPLSFGRLPSAVRISLTVAPRDKPNDLRTHTRLVGLPWVAQPGRGGAR